MDYDTGEVLAHSVTGNNGEGSGDSSQLSVLLDEIVSSGYKVSEVIADGAYDTTTCYKMIEKVGI